MTESNSTRAERALRLAEGDERERAAAADDDAALIGYEAKWRAKLYKLISRYPERWTIPGLSQEELVDELTLRLIGAIRTTPAELLCDPHPGASWTLSFLVQERRRLRASFRLNVVLADVSPLLDGAANEEERLIELETEQTYAVARERAERELSRPQRRWFAALKLSANAGGFFASSGEPNLAAASRLLDKHRSSAVRAFSELQEHFERKLNQLQK